MTVKRYLRRYGIPARPPHPIAKNQTREPTRDDLYRLIHVEHKGHREIAKEYGVASGMINKWREQFDIPRSTVWDTRRKGKRPTLPTADEMAELYDGGLSLRGIGDLYGVCDETIARLCDEYGIARKPGGFAGGVRFVCNDGQIVRSSYEQRVANWLHDRGIDYEYEPPIPGRFRSDFLANGWYIEVWGVTNSETYNRRKEAKRAIYAEHGLPLIEIAHYHFAAKRKRTLERRLSRCLHVPPPSVSSGRQTQLLLFPSRDYRG